MKVVRHGVFETNSSSCHSFTTMSKLWWEKFKKGEAYIYEDRFNIEEPDTIYNTLSADDIVSADTVFDCIKTAFLDSNFVSSIKEDERHKDHDSYKYEWGIIDLIVEVLNNDKAKEEILKCIDPNRYCYNPYKDILKKLDTPFSIRYSWNKEDTIVDSYKYMDVRWFLDNYIEQGKIKGLSPIYRYNDSDTGWDDSSLIRGAEIKYTLKLNKPLPEGVEISCDKEGIEIEKISDTEISIKDNTAETVTVERDEEC